MYHVNVPNAAKLTRESHLKILHTNCGTPCIIRSNFRLISIYIRISYVSHWTSWKTDYHNLFRRIGFFINLFFCRVCVWRYCCFTVSSRLMQIKKNYVMQGGAEVFTLNLKSNSIHTPSANNSFFCAHRSCWKFPRRSIK